MLTEGEVAVLQGRENENRKKRDSLYPALDRSAALPAAFTVFGVQDMGKDDMLAERLRTLGIRKSQLYPELCNLSPELTKQVKDYMDTLQYIAEIR